jgi:tetrahydromethanopterin S-methyltransferase subunit D
MSHISNYDMAFSNLALAAQILVTIAFIVGRVVYVFKVQGKHDSAFSTQTRFPIPLSMECLLAAAEMQEVSAASAAA